MPSDAGSYRRFGRESLSRELGDAMLFLGATAITPVTLFIVDHFLNAGRYSEAAASVLVQAGSIVRVRV
jgi:hypothetical protein